MSVLAWRLELIILRAQEQGLHEDQEGLNFQILLHPTLNIQAR